MMLDLAQIKETGSGPQNASLSAKTAALAEWLGDVLALHATDGHAWRVATYTDSRILATGLSPSVRDGVMGNPVRYAEAVWTGRTTGYDPTAPGHVFAVGVYYGTALSLASSTLAADTAAAWSAFRALCEAASDTVPGVLYACDRQSELVVSTSPLSVVELGNPQNVEAGRAAGDGRTASDLLGLTFTVTLS